jgi:three-Cys-motif partner protein
MTHEYGGLWTRKKLTVLEQYLAFYTQALKNQNFTLHYADAFAGTGSQSQRQIQGQEVLIPIEDLKGSVITALEVEPGFDHYHFNDLNEAHIKELERIKGQYPDKTISISQLDANEFIPKFCQTLGAGDRAVLFIDPYSTQLDWATLSHVANSEKIDLWLLFPLSVILRMTPHGGVEESWRNTLDRLLGTNQWEDALYKPSDVPVTTDLFGEKVSSHNIERLNVTEMQKWISGRLKELFPFVARPVQLDNKNHPLFLFYFAVSNKSKKAWGLAEKVVTQIINKNIGVK